MRCLCFAIDQYYMSMSSIDLAFAKTLKQLRRDKRLTQEELAQRAGLDYKYLQKLEGKAPSSPTLSTLEKLATLSARPAACLPTSSPMATA